MGENRTNKVREIALTVIWVAAVICAIIFVFLRFSALWDIVKKVIDVLNPFVIGLILCYLTNPLFERIRKFLSEKKWKKKASDAVASIACVVLVMVAIYGIFALVIPKLIESLTDMVRNIPAVAARYHDWYVQLQNSDFELKEYALDFLDSLESYSDRFISESITPNIQQIATDVFSSVVSVVRALYNFIIGIIAMVYLLNNKDNLLPAAKRIVYSVMPRYAGGFCARIRQFNKIFGGFITGKLIDSLIIGVLCFVITSLFRIPYALLVSVFVGVTNIIPFFGPFIGAIPTALIVLINDPQKGLIFIIIVFVLQQIDGNFIGPKILGDSIGISGLSVLFSIIVGGGLFGFVGMLLAVPTWAFIEAIIDDRAAKRLAKAGLPTEVKDYGKGMHPQYKGGLPGSEGDLPKT